MGRSSAAAEFSPEHVTARTTLVRELMDLGMPIEAAERWCAAWEAEADRQGVQRNSRYYWDGGRGWIDAQRSFARVAR